MRDPTELEDESMATGEPLRTQHGGIGRSQQVEVHIHLDSIPSRGCFPSKYKNSRGKVR